MSLWNTFRLLFNSAIVIAVGYTIRNFTHTKKFVPDGKQILTVAATKGNEAIQYTLRKKNRNKVIITILIITTVVVMCYKLKKWHERRSMFLSEKENGEVSHLKSTKSDKKDGEIESMDKRKLK